MMNNVGHPCSLIYEHRLWGVCVCVYGSSPSFFPLVCTQIKDVVYFELMLRFISYLIFFSVVLDGSCHNFVLCFVFASRFYLDKMIR